MTIRTKQDKALVYLINKKDKVDCNELMAYFNIDVFNTHSIMHSLVNRGLVKKETIRTNTQYASRKSYFRVSNEDYAKKKIKKIFAEEIESGVIHVD